MSVGVLVFGAHGQVARALATAKTPMALEFAGRDRLDLAAAAPPIAELIDAAAPAAVINAAAYTAVDRAEAEPLACARLNRDAPARLGEVCARRDIPLVHFSTDYVFDGEKGSPYVEEDVRAPLGVYGRAKAQGEDALAALAGARIAVIRTAWVFAAGGGGFFDAMRRAAAGEDEVSVVADQWGSPTPASACAAAALALTQALLDRDPAAARLFHAAGADGVSRAAFAEAIFGLTPRRPRLRRIAAADYPAPARRPRDARLSSARLAGAFGWRAPPLAEALAACLAEAGA